MLIFPSLYIFYEIFKFIIFSNERHDEIFKSHLHQFGYLEKTSSPSTNKFRFIKDEKLHSEFATYQVGVISNLKETKKLESLLNSKKQYQIPQHLSRFFKCNNGDEIHALIVRENQQYDQELDIFFSKIYLKDVMIDKPKNENEYRIAQIQWKTSKGYFPLPEKFDPDQEAIHRANIKALIDKVATNSYFNAASVFYNGKLVVEDSSTGSSIDGHDNSLFDIDHCCMKLINKLAHNNRSKKRLPDSQTTDYLATDCDVYVYREPCLMCASALLHARAKRIFFVVPNKESGALVSTLQVQYLPNINHRYDVYQYFQ